MRVIDVPDALRLVVVGEGQIGSAIVEAALCTSASHAWQFATDWSGPRAVESSIAEALSQVPPTPLPSAVVWAAGNCGMTSTAQACGASFDAFSAGVAGLMAIRPRSFSLISSAGAFGSGCLRWSGTPAANDVGPPYRHLKRAEEELLAALDVPIAVSYRVSSVYGPPHRPGRRGLVTALVENSSRLRATDIHGRWSTLRNYVHADDVAAYVVAHTLRWTGTNVHLLAADRSHSISELVRAVAAARRRPVPVRLIPGLNAEDLTVDPAAISAGFRARPINTAIRQMVLDRRQSGVR